MMGARAKRVDTSYAEVIGDPIAHSKSPAIHNHWLRMLGKDARYRAQHVRPDALQPYLMQSRADPAWRGCNVTIPHKQAVLPLVDDHSAAVQAIGAANTLVMRDGRLVAHNTDADGFAAPLSGRSLQGETAIVIGAGGAARAVLHALSARGIAAAIIVNRTRDRAAALLKSFALDGDVLAPGDALPPAALLVNASSLGMSGQAPLDIDLSSLPPSALVYDIVYDPLETPLLAAARARGLAVIDGLAMLIGQARTAFELFFDTPAPGGDSDLRRMLTS